MRSLSTVTFANTMSLIALFVALGGVSYAAVALPRDSVGTQQLRGNAVTHSKLAAGSVDTGELRDRSVEASKLALGAVKKRSLSPWIGDQLERRAAQGPPGPERARPAPADPARYRFATRRPRAARRIRGPFSISRA